MTDAARTTLISSWEEHRIEPAEGMTFIRIDAGAPHVYAIYSAVLERYNALTGRNRPTAQGLTELIEEKVTLIRHGENMLGGGMIQAWEGRFRLFRGEQIGFLPKGARTKGFLVDPEKLLDVLPGWSTGEAQRLIGEVRSHFPTLAPITQESLEQLPKENQMGKTLDKCFFGTYRLDGTQADALILAGEYWPDDDIVDRTVILLRPDVGFSEAGSMYGRQLLQGRFGEVVGYKPITFSEALSLCERDFDQAYEFVISGCVGAAA